MKVKAAKNATTIINIMMNLRGVIFKKVKVKMRVKVTILNIVKILRCVIFRTTITVAVAVSFSFASKPSS